MGHLGIFKLFIFQKRKKKKTLSTFLLKSCPLCRSKGAALTPLSFVFITEKAVLELIY